MSGSADGEMKRYCMEAGRGGHTFHRGRHIIAKRRHRGKRKARGTVMRGSEKRVIFVRDTGSRIFEEAYFIVRRGIGENGAPPTADEMVREAQRIVQESGRCYPASARRRKIRGRCLSFLAGAASAGAVIGGCAALFSLL